MDSQGSGAWRVALHSLLALSALTAAAGHAAPATDACALLTAAQVSTVLGVTVAAGEHIVPDAPTSCGWMAPGGASIGAKKITLSVMSARAFESGKTPVKGVTRTVVAGIGDDAYYLSMPPFGTALSVKKGQAFFQLRIVGFRSGHVRSLERSLALQLLERV